MRGNGNRSADAANAWQAGIHDTEVPLFLEDVTAVTRAIKSVLDDGVTDFRAWLDAHPEFLHKSLAQMQVIDVNEAALRLNGVTNRKELLDNLERFFLPETLASFKEALVAMAEGKTTYEGEAKYQTLDNREFYTWNQARLPRLTDNPALIVMSTIDITPQKTVLLRLQESETHYRQLVESVPDVFLCLEMDGTVAFVNQAGVDLTGWSTEEVVGRSFRDFVAVSHQADMNDRAAQRGEGFRGFLLYETLLRTKSGQEIPVEVSSTVRTAGSGNGRAPQMVAILRNISGRRDVESGRRETEARLLTSQKLESLGVMAGGIAHYFNNILATIVGNADLLELALPPESDRRKHLSAIQAVAGEAAEFCDQLQVYAGVGLKPRRRVNFSRAVAEMTPLLKVAVRRRAELVLQLAPDLPEAAWEDTRFRQVVMNLVNNGVEALPDTGGEIVVRTGKALFSAAELAVGRCLPTLPPGDYVFCEVGDSGHGMSPETVDRLFEPFFSTRSGHGGLGLYAAMGLVQSQGGAFLVDSGPGRGTSVKLLMSPVPRAARKANRRKAPDTLHQDLEGRTVLVVAEDPALRTMSEGMVRRLGCKVLSTASGHDAVKVFGQRHGDIDAVLLDLTMTLLDGPETCRRLRVISPHLPVVFTTGLKEGLVSHVTDEFNSCRIAHKPFTLAQLRARLAEVLAP